MVVHVGDVDPATRNADPHGLADDPLEVLEARADLEEVNIYFIYEHHVLEEEQSKAKFAFVSVKT